jgi:tetratricopeptide (TPR) repeat protein
MDISQYLPVGGNGHVLITTRNRSATEYATDGRKIRFRGLELQEAISFLLKSAYPDLRLDIPPATPRKWQLAKGIAIELGLLPLALAHAGATIRRNIYTLDKYLHYYLGHRKTTMSYPRVKSADEANIIATWEIPFQKIAKRRTLEHRDAVDLMHIFAFMHFETIPESIFRRSWIDLSDTEILPKQRPDILQTVWNEEAQSRFRRAIGVLGDHSIIDYEESTASCSMHPVIHTWARDRLTEAEQKHWLRCAMAILAECISPNLEASGRQFRASLLPHINFCLQSLKSQYPSLPETLENAAMFERFAWVYTEQCSWKTARLWHERVVKIRRKQLGRRHPQTIFAQRNLGHTLWNLFEIKPAIDVQLQVLKTLWWHRHSLKEWATWPLWKPIHTPYCLALDDLTLTLWLAGVRDKSKMTGERAVDGLTRRLGPYDPRTLNAMFNLARTYLHIGEHEKSRKLLLHVLRLQKRFFGMKHPDTLMTRNELGMNLCASKRHLPAAQSLIENVLQARKEVLGDEHAYTLWSINDLSKVYTERGYLDRALYMLEDVLVTAKRTLGEDHVGTSMTLANLAKTYFLAQKWKEAEETIRPLLARVPKQHPDWVHNMYGYAQIKFTLGDIKEAEQLCIETLDTISQTKSLAIDNPRTLAIADLLLTIYRQQGRNDDIASIKAKFPGTDKTRNEDRYDPYAIRRGSDAPPKMLSALSSSAVRPKRNSDAGQKPVHKSEHRESSPLRPGLKLVGRRTF